MSSNEFSLSEAAHTVHMSSLSLYNLIEDGVVKAEFREGAYFLEKDSFLEWFKRWSSEEKFE